MRSKPKPPSEAEIVDDVARACARFGIREKIGDRQTRILQAILGINRSGRAATPREIGEKAGVKASQVASAMQDALTSGLVVRLQLGLYVLTEKGERSLG